MFILFMKSSKTKMCEIMVTIRTTQKVILMPKDVM